MKALITNKYRDMDFQSLNKEELSSLVRSLECDISWTENDLKNFAIGEDVDALLDVLNLYKKYRKQVLKLLK
tara:strand:- start:269 stop:484 length:216 start_codon:yes stop_codon:yes gene_type:complete